MIKFLSIEANDKGEYLAKYVRFDIFNVVMSTSSYVDIAYFGIADSFERICELNAEEEDGFIVSAGSIKDTIDFETGAISPYAPKDDDDNQGDGDISDNLKTDSPYVDPSSGYYGSTLAYVSMLDFINGSGDNGAPY